MTMDTVNGLFELGGALVTLLSVRQLLRDRVMRGFHWGPTIFFTAWGCWNLAYYPHLGQLFSALGAGTLVATNAAYLGLMLRCRRPCPFCHDLPMSAGPLCEEHQQLVRTVQRARRVISPMDGSEHMPVLDEGIYEIARARMDSR